MDIRIVNTCNNNCLYCLEQSLRTKDPFLDTESIFSLIDQDDTKVLSIYGGNPLLHPYLREIVLYGKQNGYDSISILTNTHGLTGEFFSDLSEAGLTGVNFYFNSFSIRIHDTIVNGGIILAELLHNIDLISRSGLYYKVIIHVNAQNILHLYRDVFILYSKFGVRNFEFVNYFPFDRPYESFKEVLSYNFIENRKEIDQLFKVMKKLKFFARFSKFSRDFFGNFDEFYDFEQGIRAQISKEDEQRLTQDIPSCYEIQRCKSCFIKDNCKMHV